MPGILSGGSLAFIEPHEDFFEKPDERGKLRPTSTKRWLLQDFKQLYQGDLHDQFQPFLLDVFGSSADVLSSGRYNGTLFRFPLRQESNKSELSQVVYGENKVNTLFDTLEKQPEMSLLFLKNLEKIEVYERKDENSPAEILLTVQINAASVENVRDKRQQFISSVREAHEQTSPLAGNHQVYYPVTIETDNNKSGKRVTDWLVVHHHAGDRDIQTKLDTEFASVKHLPWVSAAFQNTGDVPSHPRGHVFCFLPLPLQERSITGFHAHVNGYFAVAQNRRHLKWPAADQDLKTVDDKDILWNQFLLTDVISKVMVELVLYGIQEGVDPEVVYSLIPNESLVQPEWKPVLKTFYELLFTKAVFHSAVSDGMWLSLTEAVFDSPEMNMDKTLTLSNIFLQGGVRLVSPPQYIQDALLQYTKSQPKTVNPALMRNILKNNREFCRCLDEAQRNIVLSYILSDGNHQDLVGIEDILCLANGLTTGFLSACSTTCIYIASDNIITLLDGAEDRFLQNDSLTETVAEKLRLLARSGETYNIYLPFAVNQLFMHTRS